MSHPASFVLPVIASPTIYKKFPDGTDELRISGFTPQNNIMGKHILFLASFQNNDSTLAQLYVLIVLLQSFIESMTIVLPFYPCGTMERCDPMQRGGAHGACWFRHGVCGTSVVVTTAAD